MNDKNIDSQSESTTISLKHSDLFSPVDETLIANQNPENIKAQALKVADGMNAVHANMACGR